MLHISFGGDDSFFNNIYIKKYNMVVDDDDGWMIWRWMEGGGGCRGRTIIPTVKRIIIV